jgi:ATP-binding cassette subfamily B protein
MSTRNSNPSYLQLARWSLGFALRRWVLMVLTLLTMVCNVGLGVLKPWPTAFFLDYVLRGKALPPALAARLHPFLAAPTPQSLLNCVCIFTLLLFLLGWLVGLANSFASVSLYQRMSYDLASELFAKLQRLSMRFHVRKSVGDNIFRLTNDCACVANIFKNGLLPLAWAVITVTSMFLILCRIDFVLASLLLLVVPFTLLVIHRYARRVRAQSLVQRKYQARMNSLVEQVFSSMPVVQAFCREESNDQAFAHADRDWISATLVFTRLQIEFKFFMSLSVTLGTVGILCLGASHVWSGQISFGSIVVFMYYLNSLKNPLQSIMKTDSNVQGYAGSAERIWEILQSEVEVTDAINAKPLSEVQGRVQLEGVTFGYETGRPVLRDISLDIAPGETVALVGATGAGKTTLVSLIPRFFDPWKGCVKVDGMDIRDLQVQSLRGNIAIVLQEPFLFPRSIAENIAYGKPGARLEEIISAARAANAHEFIMKLPSGYDTIVGDRGGTLSGGERQRISIARALLKDAPILILDEPSSALDTETEQLVVEALGRLIRSRTTLIIAHRLSTIMDADRVVVLENGGVVEQGTHEELVNANGIYSRYYELQFHGAAAGAFVAAAASE